MRILHIITSLRQGGAERLVTDLLPRFRDSGHEVELLLFDGTETPLLGKLAADGIPVSSFGKGATQMYNPFNALWLRKFLRCKHFDVVHTHNTPCQLLTALAAPASGPVLVTTEHNTFNRRRGWRWYRGIDRWMYGRYRSIACVSELTKRRLIELLGPDFDDKRVSVIANGIDLTRFADAGSHAHFGAGAGKEKHIVLMVAAFRPQKDQATLIRAMTHLPDDYELWLAGDGETRPSCEKLSGTLSLGDRVRFLGACDDVPGLSALADVAVLSSHYEGMPLSAVESMAAGLPVIASDVEGLRDTIGNSGLLFRCGDELGLAQAIRRVCEDGELYGTLVRRGRERAAKFGIDAAADAYERLYKKECGS